MIVRRHVQSRPEFDSQLGIPGFSGTTSHEKMERNLGEWRQMNVME
jgi:hypothetical protein